MRYISTRGDAPILDFEGVVLAGLASDGGLYVPESWPQFLPSDLASMAQMNYVDLACAVLTPLVGKSLSANALRAMVEDAYTSFRHPAVAPLVQTGQGQWVLELFHGPTLAFKDFALQLLGRLLEHALASKGTQATIIGATSGDTGSAAIAGCRGRKGMRMVILHPHGKVSEVQRRQMTTVLDDNVLNLAIDGSFDDCQAMVKAMFNDVAFREQHRLAAVNSINWARIAAQIVYYFYAALALGAPAKQVSFAVPTGNFGDVYAGYVAHKMGLPIRRLVVATNRNDIVSRFIQSGEYRAGDVVPTLAPSMDIQVSSNLERLWFEMLGRDGHAVARQMTEFREKGQCRLAAAVPSLFIGQAVGEEEMFATMRQTYHETGMVLDPHTAIGVAAARTHAEAGVPMVTLATASPAKFGMAVKGALGFDATLPPSMQGLLEAEERFTVLPNSIDAVKQAISGTQK